MGRPRRTAGGLSGSMLAAAAVAASLCVQRANAGVNIDGGRSQLPGMKQDMFDQPHLKKGGAPGAKTKGPPDCPKPDKTSPFTAFAFSGQEVYVKVTEDQEKCSRLITIGGANYSVLKNASRTCGPIGEWKSRVAQEMSGVFFQAGLDWPKHDGEMMDIVTEDGTYQVPVTEANYELQTACWARGCGCDQAKNPIGRGVLLALLLVAVTGLLWDSGKVAWHWIRGKKPSRHVCCPKGYRLEEVKLNRHHLCDVCKESGTTYQSTYQYSTYDMCKLCYKEAKKKLKKELEAWYVKHPADRVKDEEKRKSKKTKDGKDASDDEGRSEAESATNTGAEATSEAESSAGKTSGTSAAEAGDEKNSKGGSDDKSETEADKSEADKSEPEKSEPDEKSSEPSEK